MIHRFTVAGRRFVLDVFSGSLHEVDDLAWELVEPFCAGDEAALARASASHDPPAVASVLAELTALREQGLVDAPCPVPDGFEPEPGGFKAMCLHLAHDCDLACGYCFAEGGPFGSDRGLMSEQTARRAIDFLLEHGSDRRHFDVDFFGGEPTLNFEVLRRTVAYAEECGTQKGATFRFTVTTNAFGLTREMQEYLNDKGIAVVLSLDGRPEVHNRLRKTRSGQSTHQVILENSRSMVKSRQGQNYYVRGTFTRHNLDFTNDARYLVEQGFNIISLEPVVAEGHFRHALQDAELPAILAEYDRLAEFCAERAEAGAPFTFFHFALEPAAGPCVTKRITGCGAGWEYLVVTPAGELFPCHQFVGRSKYRLGTLETGIERPDLTEQLRLTHARSKPTCRECWAQFYCGGGCHANADLFNGTVSEPYALGCEMQKRRIELALYLQARRGELVAES
ncbi:MAG: thioether cross-link-forming SCIFF peptide maturase [Bacillota bacterium]